MDETSAFRRAYDRLVASGAIEADPAQAEAVEALSLLEARLEHYKPRKNGLFGRLFADKDAEPPHGLYIHGEVGRGKTMLMDLFFQNSHVTHKRRAHFHEFMADVHERIYGFRRKSPSMKFPIPIPFISPRLRSSRMRGFCVSTNSTSPTLPMR